MMSTSCVCGIPRWSDCGPSRHEREPDADRLYTVIEHPIMRTILRFVDPRYVDGDGED
jgi:hypothetical protein